MKLIIAGTRTMQITNEIISDLLTEFNLEPTEIISGGASGIDSCAARFAKDNLLLLTVFEADWKTHGRAAGPIRNEEMAKTGDALLLIWDGKSRGSADMKRQAVKHGKKVYEMIVDGEKRLDS